MKFLLRAAFASAKTLHRDTPISSTAHPPSDLHPPPSTPSWTPPPMPTPKLALQPLLSCQAITLPRLLLPCHAGLCYCPTYLLNWIFQALPPQLQNPGPPSWTWPHHLPFLPWFLSYRKQGARQPLLGWLPMMQAVYYWVGLLRE